MTHSIPGNLDWSRLYFTVLSQAEQAAAIRRLRATGMSPRGIAEATGLSLEQVERVLEGAS